MNRKIPHRSFMLCPPISFIQTLIFLLFFSVLGIAGPTYSYSTSNTSGLSENDRTAFNESDLEVHYEFDAVQIIQSTGGNPMIGTITYTLMVTNNGPDDATNVEVGINYHDEVVPFDREMSTGYWEINQWIIPNLPAGTTVQMTESSNIFIPYNNKWVQASLQEMDQDDPDSTPGNWDFAEDDSDMLEIYYPECDLDLTLAVNDPEYDIYEQVNYEVVVQNFGPSIATNVSVSFPLPPGMVFSDSDATQGDYDLYYETWNIGTLAIGQTVLLNLDLFTLDAAGPKVAFAQVQTSDQPDPDSEPGNDTDQTPDEDDEAAVTIYPIGYGSTCVGNIALTTQAEVDAFGPCTVFDGSITIEGIDSDITDLSAFDGLREITGSLQIQNCDDLVNIEGFNDLETVGEYLWIIDNYDLVAMNAFDKLESIGENFVIYGNPSLNYIDDIHSPFGADGFVFSGNHQMTNLDAFDGLIDLNYLIIESNDVLENLNGMLHIPPSMESISLQNNPGLQNINGLSNVTNVSGDLRLISLGFVQSHPFHDLYQVGGNLEIRGNNYLQSLSGYYNLNEVGGNLQIKNNPLLSDCCDIFPLLDEGGIQGSINISNNQSFCNSADEILTDCGSTDYCDSYSNFPWHEWISRVQLNTLDQSSGKSVYSDFTSSSTTLGKGNTYPITMKTSFSYTTYDEYWRVWIDFNQNGSFTDPGEMVFNSVLNRPPNGTPSAVLNGNIAIPMNALLGNTRMRISMQRGSAPTPCAILPFGEVEDYTVNISETGIPGDYCESEGDFPWHEWIGKVTFADIENTSGKSKYSDFTSINTMVDKGTSYPVTLQTNFSYTTYDEYWRVWIDFDKNGSFLDPGEMVFDQVLSRPPNGTPFATISGSIFIPDNAPQGNTRMRVSMQRGSAPSPCGVIPYGEVEDYTLSINNSFGGSANARMSSNEIQVELFPNPVVNELYVSLTEHAGQSARVSLSDLYGRIVLDQTIEVIPNYPIRIDLSGIENGMYLLSTKVDDLKMATNRIVVEKMR